jgi:hypothetical protein
MTAAHVHPSAFIARELARLPITFRSLVNSAIITTKGGASSPFNIAYQNSILNRVKTCKIGRDPQRSLLQSRHRIYGLALA